MKHRCCTDNACTPETCMALPEEKHCSDCIYANLCHEVFGHSPEDDFCDWFPRRFKERKERAMTPNDIVHKALRHQQIIIPDRGRYTIQSACLFFDDEAGTIGIEVVLTNQKKIFVPANHGIPGVYLAC